jgi:hypothetical protein
MRWFGRARAAAGRMASGIRYDHAETAHCPAGGAADADSFPSFCDDSQDIVVECVAYDGKTMQAHTLKVLDPKGQRTDLHPSVRYATLILDGAIQHSVSSSYVAFLETLPRYQCARIGPKIGRVAFLFTMALVGWPLVVALILSTIVMPKRKGEPRSIPLWGHRAMSKFIRLGWWSHDYIFAPVFGTGCRSSGPASARVSNSSATEKLKGG